MEHKFMQRKPESMRLFPVLLLLLTFACSDFKGHQLINGTQGGRNRGTSDGSAPMSQKSRQRIARPSG